MYLYAVRIVGTLKDGNIKGEQKLCPTLASAQAAAKSMLEGKPKGTKATIHSFAEYEVEVVEA